MFGAILWIGGLLILAAGGLLLYEQIITQLAQALR